LELDGAADVVQLTVKGAAAQSGNNIIEVDRSGGQNLWTLDNNGAVGQTIRGGNTGLVLAVLADSRQVSVLDSASVLLRVINAAGQIVFEVRDDGTLHGQTGKSLAFDL